MNHIPSKLSANGWWVQHRLDIDDATALCLRHTPDPNGPGATSALLATLKTVLSETSWRLRTWSRDDHSFYVIITTGAPLPLALKRSLTHGR